MRPVLRAIVTKPSQRPTTRPNDSIEAAVQNALGQPDFRYSARVTRISREPTKPVPPSPGAKRKRRPLPQVKEIAPYRVPTDLLEHLNNAAREMLKPARGAADVLAIYDAAWSGRKKAIKAAGLRLHVVAATPFLHADPRAIEHVVGTMLDVAVEASPRATRVHLVAREDDGVELVVSFAASWHTGTDEHPAEKSPPVDALPGVSERLHGLDRYVADRGGKVDVDSDAEHTTVRVWLPLCDVGAQDAHGAQSCA